MKRDFVVDNSVVMAWCFQDEASQYADAILGSLEVSRAIVPSIWPLEVENVLLVAELRNRLSEADSARFIALLTELPITIEQESPERMMREILALAREHQISSYDASYLDLAMRKGVPIATLDNGLIKASERSQVPIMKRAKL
ncbi:MAG: type II toxin-antitoxin system VapC family toxin [Deltaproteobacteria bacterium]|nr:type II toxin-antitoxin system VapC family toxin [Deltaproteobacteria bacterium]MBW1718635.1 type II toxin-antitoxin system VapC family toxin [Deltaproteobacteria bacterium]MBW1938569.1 type II toxin-antitoxin system VapC family toxin [Deltaproteobacteria bacterium]MBW1964139.1 type II toxin-antitoxin system VapC family toxin [Deltaproteobacteria bacterium]MBW2079923.1 type II toxin-antitoxin system VapC family toxin [Deltaproteobacteria bacterium]